MKWSMKKFSKNVKFLTLDLSLLKKHLNEIAKLSKEMVISEDGKCNSTTEDFQLLWANRLHTGNNIICTVDDKVVGFACHHYPKDLIFSVYVDADYRRKGLASGLIKSLNIEKGCILFVDQDNHAAIELYKSCGMINSKLLMMECT